MSRATRKGSGGESNHFLDIKCWFCGIPYLLPVHRRNEHEREVLDLILNSHPIQHFTQERIRAAKFWFAWRSSEKEKYEQANNKDLTSKPRITSLRSHDIATLSLSERKAKQDREILKQKAKRFREAKMEHFKRLAKGPESFPIDETLWRIRSEEEEANNRLEGQLLATLGLSLNSEQCSEIDSLLSLFINPLNKLKMRGACEIVLWKEYLPQTAAEIEFFERERQIKIDLKIENKRRDDERKRLEADRAQAQQLERERLQSDRSSRERDRLQTGERCTGIGSRSDPHQEQFAQGDYSEGVVEEQQFQVVHDSWPALFDRLMQCDAPVRMPERSLDERFYKARRGMPYNREVRFRSSNV